MRTNKVKQKDIFEFNKALSLLLYAHIGFLDALEIIIRQVKNETFKKILREIMHNLRTGMRISACFARYPGIFPEVFVAALKVGEETGALASVISEYTHYSEKIQRVRQKAVSATRYPAFVSVAALCTVMFMVWFLIPNFEGVFTAAGKETPAFSKAIFSVAAWIRGNILFLTIIPVIIIFTISKNTGSKIFRNASRRIIQYIPMLAKLYKSNIMARFSFTMNTLLKNRVPLVEALKIAKNASADEAFNTEIEFIIKNLVKGQNFSQVLNHSRFFDITFVKLLTAAEGASELDKAFMMTADFYTNEFDDRLEIITSFMEPVMILFIGFSVGIVLIALYLPMFEMLNNFGF